MGIKRNQLSSTYYGQIQLVIVLCITVTCTSNTAQPATQHKSLSFGIQTGLARVYPKYKGLVMAYNIPKVIFAQQGYDITVMEYPGKRLPLTVAHGDVDLSLASRFSLAPYGDKLISTDLPVAVLTFNIYYHNKSHWTPVWPPDAMFKNKLGKSKISSVLLANKYGLNISQASNVDSIVKMVNLKRIDYWLEYASSDTLVAPGLLNTQDNEFNYSALFSLPTYIYFQNTQRGKRLKRIYDRGLLDLLEQGKFITTYFEQTPPGPVDSTILTLAYIKQNHPELNIPQQLPITTLKHSAK